MNNISIRIMCACFVVVVAAAIVGVFAYDYVKVDEIPENKLVIDTIEEERFTVEYKCSSAMRVYHDNKLNVTCWYPNTGCGGFSCIPDNQLNIS